MKDPAKVYPCPGCQRPSRPTGGLAADYPGTVVRFQSGMCKPCYSRIPKTSAHPYTLAGLATFLRRRHEREQAQARANYYKERMSRA